ncbi:MAG: asparaginase [Lacisediminihabitans sp.]
MSHPPYHPLGPEGVRELAVLERNGLIESRHLGAAVVVSPDGPLLRSLGDTRALVYPRSSLKLVQATAVLHSGVTLGSEQKALATASHAGTPRHLTVVREILSRAGLDETALQCPPDWPLDAASRDALLISGESRRSIFMNCSGKHASFLLACVHNGWPIESYLDPTHPLQQLIRDTTVELTGEAVQHTGVDGCGAPVHAVSLAGLARAVSTVSRDTRAGSLASSILAHPWAIDGPGRANTVAIEKLGIVAKGGAEGVMVMGTADGTAVALKILDGSLRAATLVALELLVTVGAVSRSRAAEIVELTTERVLGGGVPVGRLRVSSELSSWT